MHYFSFDFGCFSQLNELNHPTNCKQAVLNSSIRERHLIQYKHPKLGEGIHKNRHVFFHDGILRPVFISPLLIDEFLFLIININIKIFPFGFQFLKVSGLIFFHFEPPAKRILRAHVVLHCKPVPDVRESR